MWGFEQFVAVKSCWWCVAKAKITLRVLHLDDDPFEIDRMARLLKENALGPDWKLRSVSSAEDYLRELRHFSPHLAILDFHLGELVADSGTLVAQTRELSPNTVIFMCSAMDDVATISHCQGLGADDFISKRSRRDQLNLRLAECYELACLKRGIPQAIEKNTESEITSSQKNSASHDFSERNATAPVLKGAYQSLNGAGRTFENVRRRVPLLIQSAVSAVHIEGESGTGKEVVADLFASLLPSSTPFVKVNCGAISASLLESELFGHVRGAYTGAIADKKGLLESASGGWIFLDEVASLSSNAQVALLRALENQELRRVGASATIQVNVRILSATNEPLAQLVAMGKFRKDLWQRLCEAEISLPPLRERSEEIAELVQFFCERMPGGPFVVDDAAMEVLTHYTWESGNVRELRNCLRAMTEFQVNRRLTAMSIPERIWKKLDAQEGKLAAVTLESAPPLGISRTELNGTSEISCHRGDELLESFSTSQFGSEVPIEQEVTLSVKFPLQFDSLSDGLLVELIRKHSSQFGKSSLRKFAKAIGMSRSTLSGRLKAIVQANQMPSEELNLLMGLTESSTSRELS